MPAPKTSIPKNNTEPSVEGILLVNKPKGKTSFSLVASLRKKLKVAKIGHAGTLDPFATGVMVMLIGRNFTRLSDSFLTSDKEYLAELTLGCQTDTYDCDGAVTAQSPSIPSLEEVKEALKAFQGEVSQTPPMFSAKKVNGKKLYELARKGKEIERESVKVHMECELIAYSYPHLVLRVSCSKGTYVRSIAHDLGLKLGCGAFLSKLERTRSGSFHLKDCLDGGSLNDMEFSVLCEALRKVK